MSTGRLEVGGYLLRIDGRKGGVLAGYPADNRCNYRHPVTCALYNDRTSDRLYLATGYIQADNSSHCPGSSPDYSPRHILPGSCCDPCPGSSGEFFYCGISS